MNLNVNNTNRFDGKAKDYAIARPGYSPEINKVFDSLTLNGQTIAADIGAGTGIFSEFLLKRGYTVYSVEPNTDMRNSAEVSLKKYPKSIIVAATAEKTTLPDKSVDLITVAQAFHWFPIYEFKKESLRILKDKGKMLIIWNLLNDKSKLIKSVEQCMKFYNNKFHGFNAGINYNDIYFCIPEAQMSIFNYDILYSKETFRKRWTSSSFSPNISSLQYTDFIHDIDSIFLAHTTDGTVTIENQTIVYTGIPTA